MGIDLKALDKAFKSIDKIDSKVVKTREEYEDYKFVPCSSPELNRAIGGKGLPVGRCIETFGALSGGKSTLSIVIASDYQKDGFYCIYMDYERTFDYSLAEAYGLDTSEEAFRLLQPEHIHQGFEIAQQLAETGTNIIFVFDSVSSMLTQAEIDNNFEKASIGLQARAMSAGLKKLTPIFDEHDCSALFINQVRDKIGAYVPTEVTSGGRSLGFYSTIRLRVRKTEDIMEGDTAIGFKQAINVAKNKIAPPKGSAELTYYYTTGLDTTGGIIDDACEKEFILKKAGGNFYLTLLNGEELRVRGKLNLINYMKENEEYFEDLKVKLGLKAEDNSATIEE